LLAAGVVFGRLLLLWWVWWEVGGL
jgi:hypothetical protein